MTRTTPLILIVDDDAAFAQGLRVWRGAPAPTADIVRVQVGALRRKLEPDPSHPRYIVTEPWIGYRFAAEPLA